ncbi:Erythroferrone like protein [Argiope bruennichi]|uniref:Erythroferrone like protein n=1 Tax=Argiope bruennichi TaxID=94029 RepID=A0A8T0EDN2_ARGBR|nr:Erythroferrone like protein [Argiope bruennichi]
MGRVLNERSARTSPASPGNLSGKGWPQNEKRTRKKNRERAIRQQLRMGIPQTKSAIGPQGPRGPPGPMGPKGANISKDEMVEEIRNILNEMAHQKILSSLNPECTELCYQNLDENETNTFEDKMKIIHKNVLVPKIVTAFMWESEEYFKIPRQSRVELDMFKLADKSGAYGRDDGNSRPDTGKFVAPRSGFYNFYATVHIQLPTRKRDLITTEDLISLAICVESECSTKSNGDRVFSSHIAISSRFRIGLFFEGTLEAISGFGPGERMTMSVGGMLYLKLNQYVSVYVENASDFPVSIFDGSQFSGYLIGV